MKVRGCVFFLLIACATLSTPGFFEGGSGEGSTHKADDQAVGRLTEMLYSRVPADRDKAKSALEEIAKKSPQSRGLVIGALINLLKDPKALRATSSGAWYCASELLGDLKAVEAIPPLVEHLDYSDGIVGFSLSHFPAVKALVKIGKPAVPYLVKALSNPQASIRRNAAFTLGDIGDEAAIPALKHAAKRESNREVKFYMQKSLSQLGVS